MNPKIAAKWLEAWDYCQKNSSVPAVLVAEAVKKRRQALRTVMDQKPRLRLPRGTKAKTPQQAKKDLRKELEALCKAIVFTRDCGSPEARDGRCVTCKEWRVLQWGHFIRQQDCKWLQFDPRNTAGQCARCNMAGGRVLEYSAAIDARDGKGAAKALQNESNLKKAMGWRPNKTTLGKMLERLRLHPLAPKVPGERSEPEQGNTQVTVTDKLP